MSVVLTARKIIIVGRPHGGRMYTRSIADKVKFIKGSNNRLCAATVELDDRPPLLLVNVYMFC